VLIILYVIQLSCCLLHMDSSEMISIFHVTTVCPKFQIDCYGLYNYKLWTIKILYFY